MIRLFAQLDARHAKEFSDLLDDRRGNALLANEIGGDGDVLLQQRETERTWKRSRTLEKERR